MTAPKFTHLHAHTDASLKDGLRPIAETMRIVANKGFKHHAMTDHGTLANAVSFAVEAELNGIKPIIGVEGYILAEPGDDAYGHITLLANGDSGFSSIVALQNLAHQAKGKRPAFTVDQLITYSRDVILLTGCVSSPLQQMSWKDAVSLGAKLKGAFGSRMFAEVMFVADTDTYSRPIKLAEALGLKIVVTNDAHFPEKVDAKIHPLLTSMKAGYTYNSAALYLKTGEEILASAKRSVREDDAFEWIERAFNLAEKITPVKLKREPQLPHIEAADRKLLDKVMPIAKKMGPKYEERVKYEYGIISKMGFSTYFLVLEDIISWSKSNGVRVGPGRGSGAGSLILFILGVTTIDPVQFNLPFERFLNPFRKGMPDVDVDFDSENRHMVIEYAKSRWSANPVATYSRYSHKSLVHGLAKVLHIARDEEEAIAEASPESDEFAAAEGKYPQFGQAYHSILGQISHMGKHAGGIVISGDAVVPIEKASSGELVVAWTEGRAAELTYAGLVKYDLLGLSALSVLRRLEKIHGTKAPAPTDGDEVFDIFKQGDLAGIFQFSGSVGIRDLTMKIAPEKFLDLVAINALYRPGALDVGSADKYPEWKKKPRKIHPLIDDILAETYGAIVFQEQVMAIIARCTDGSLASADEARKTISKIKEADREAMDKLARLQDKFLKGAIEKGIDGKVASKIWEELFAHSRYSFNKAHSVAYAMVAWETAWWKYHYRNSFYAQSINVTPDDTQVFLLNAINDGIELVMPHVNNSGWEYTADKSKIYLPLSVIKFLSTDSARQIVEEREKSGPFKSAADFMKRLPKRVIRGQARAGLFYMDALKGLKATTEMLEIGEETEMPKVGTDAKKAATRKYMGVVLPNADDIAKVNRAKARGQMAGIITSIENRTSTYGPYHVVKLMPTGVFWFRGVFDVKKLNEGDVVAATVRGETGKATRIEIL